MADRDAGSPTCWIGDLKAGGDSAAHHPWERYFNQLDRMARGLLRSARRAGAFVDGEDAVLSAFDSFCRGTAAGRFPQVADRDDLWRSMVAIAVRKAFAQIEHQGARRRGGGRIAAASGRAGDEYRRLRDSLEDESLRRRLGLRPEGDTGEELAEPFGGAERTVRREPEAMREAWMRGDA